jgi:hypothetical protein
MTEKHPGGRPSKYTPELLENCRKYVYGGWEECGDLIPSIAGLACELQVSRETLHQWAKDEKKPEFSDMYKDLLSFQERKLISGGLSGDFSSAITKMVMYKHGYSEKVEQDHTSSDGTMTPTVIERVIVKPDASE